MPGTSFIIPVLNEAPAIATFLRRLRETFPDSRIIVVDGGSSDDTAALARPLCDALLESPPGRARQMNRGAAFASDGYYLFLHADTMPGISSSQLQTLLDSGPAWGFCRVRLTGTEKIFALISWFMNWRSQLTGVATGDQMQFVRADVFTQTGGFDEIPLMEDIAYSKRLRKYARPQIVQQPNLVSSRRWRERGIVRTVVTMWLLRLGYFLGVSPGRLWQVYYGG